MKRLIMIPLLLIILVGCGNPWESKEVLNKTTNMEEVIREVPDPKWEYAWICGNTISTRFDCGFKYGYNSRAIKNMKFNEIVYRVEMKVKYEDGTYETKSIEVDEEEYNEYKIGSTIYRGER